MLLLQIEEGLRKDSSTNAAPEHPPHILKIMRHIAFDCFDQNGQKIEVAYIKKRASQHIVQNGKILGKTETRKDALALAEAALSEGNYSNGYRARTFLAMQLLRLPRTKNRAPHSQSWQTRPKVGSMPALRGGRSAGPARKSISGTWPYKSVPEWKLSEERTEKKRARKTQRKDKNEELKRLH